MEERLKQLIGDLMFANIALQTQLEEAQKKIKELQTNAS